MINHAIEFFLGTPSKKRKFAAMKADKKLKVCVFGASSAHVKQCYLDDAYRLGQLLAQHGWHNINGGGAIGLMGSVTDGTLDAGGTVTGVIPKFMVDNGWCYDRLDDVLITADMHQRKAMMSEMCDVVVALPGGVGTWEELLEATTWKQLGITTLPIVLLNTAGYYDDLLRLIGHAVDEGFMKPVHRNLFLVAATPEQAIDMLIEASQNPPSNVESKY